MTPDNRIRFGLTGLGGYGGEIIERLLAEMESPNPRAVLSAVCEPNPQKHSALAAKLRSHKIQVISDYDRLLADQSLDIVWLTLPIDLHREYTERTLQAGKAVLCEKPAAGSVDDVDAMIAARDRAGLAVAVGFQDIYQPAVGELKRRILRGEFGIVLSASVLGCWPRSNQYFTRNGWAGRIARDGRWVLDSPANNAMAHYLHLALFLLGAAEKESVIPTEVEAELYRANEIENYDTASMRLTFANGVHLLLAMTHACETAIDPEIIIRTQYARIRYVHERQIEIHHPSATETIPLVRNKISPMLDVLVKWLKDGPESAIGATLEMAKAHTLTINAASQTAPIINIPLEFISSVNDVHGNPIRSVRGIEAVLEASIRRGRMLHELSEVKWSMPASDINLQNYSHFPGPASPEKKPGT